LQNKRFSRTKKRELITPLACAISLRTELTPF
jgi:hypothetical protein